MKFVLAMFDCKRMGNLVKIFYRVDSRFKSFSGVHPSLVNSVYRATVRFDFFAGDEKKD